MKYILKKKKISKYEILNIKFYNLNTSNRENKQVYKDSLI